MIVINLLSFIKTFDAIKTNLVAQAVFKYGAFITKLVMYVFIFVVLILMMINLQKKRKEIAINDNPNETGHRQAHMGPQRVPAVVVLDI